MTQADLDDRLKILPITGTLQQGTKNVGDQFIYRFNTDDRTVVGAVVQFHRCLWFTIFASSDPKIIEIFSNPNMLRLPGSVMVRPGELLGLIPKSVSLAS
jgi:hypothetical protein